ncbi:MAG: amidohydrolase family protein [Verrucomicrobia bacterium]|nr:amidohydrolase family protein [Verrucomicrobiota bacterium]
MPNFTDRSASPGAARPLAAVWFAHMVFLAAPWAVHAQLPTAPVEGLRDASPRVHAITGARIVTAPGAAIERGTVVLRDGLIAAVGPEADVNVPADARVWPAEGKTIYAGLVEPLAEVHLPAALKAPATATPGEGGRGGRGGRGAAPTTPTETIAPAAAARSWNARVTPERDVAKVLVADDRGATALRELGFASAVVTPGRGIFRGESALVSLSGRAPNATLVRARVAQHVAFEVGGFRDGGYPGSLMGCIALIRQTMLDAQWLRAALDAHGKNPAIERPEENASLHALFDYVTAAKPVVMDAADELDLLRAQKIAGEFKLKLVLRGRGTEYRMAAALAAKKTPVIVPLNFPAVPEVETPEKAADVSLATLQHWELAPANAGRLAAKGVAVAFTTAGLRTPDSQFWPAVRLAIKRGLAPEAALAAVTTAPAQMLGVADLVGTLAPGRLGHLIVATGDLFAADSTAEITDVWVDGIHFETEAAQKVDARGTWTVAWRGATAPDELRIESRPGGGPTGPTAPATGGRPRARLGGKDLTLAQSRNQLTLLAPADVFQGADAKGTVRLAGTVTGGMIEGTGLLPDGTAFRWSAERTAAAEKPAAPAPREEKFLATTDAWPAGAYGRKGIPAQPGWVLVKNATIWTSGPAGRIAGGDLLVHAGRIERIGKNLAAPAGAVVIDATGRHLTAGLIDCHSHTAISRGVNEGTSAVSVEVRVGDVLDATDVGIYRQLGGGLTVANLLHGSANPMGGQNQVIKLRWGAPPEELKFAGAKPGVKFALGENVKRSNFTPPAGTPVRYPQTRMGVEQIMADTFAQARDYERAGREFKDGRAPLPPRRNLRLEAALEILKGERVVHIHSYRQDEVLMFIRLAQREKLTVATFQHILEGYKVADEMAKLGAGGSAFSDWWAYKYEVADAIPHGGAMMRAAGVVVSYNSDNNELARRLNTEAAKAVKYGGVPEDEALKFVTLNPAKQLRIDDRVGSLEPGKDADFVIWSGSPLSTYTRAEQTWIDGRRYFSLEDDAALRAAATTEREALAQKALAERMRTLAGGGPATGARRGGDAPAAAEPPAVLRLLEAIEARHAREHQSIYHDGADALNCTTHALQ